MPINPVTGKADRRALPAETILEYRIAQEKRKKGKKRACESPETSAEVPSPSAPLANLTLDSGPSSTNTPIDSPAIAHLPPLPDSPAPAPSVASSAARTLADRPTTAPIPPLPEASVPAPRASRRTGRPSARASKSDSKAPLIVLTQHLAGFAVVMPASSQFLKVGRPKPSRSTSDASPASDVSPASEVTPASETGSLLDRIAAMERRQEQYDARQEQLAARIATIEKRQEKFEKVMHDKL